MDDYDAARDERREDDAKYKGDRAIDDQPIGQLIRILCRSRRSQLAKC